MALAELCGFKEVEHAFDKFNPFLNDRSDPMTELKFHSKQLDDDVTFLRTPIVELPGSKYSKDIVDGATGEPLKIHLAHGTTTLAFKYQGGLVVAADSRATAGSYMSSGSVHKIIHINKFLLGTMAGGAADCSYWQRVLSKQCRMYELRNRERISVAAASKLLSNMTWRYRGMISMGTFVAGFDKTGPALYYVDSEGMRTVGKVMSCGSGSLFAYGVMDRGYKWDLSDEAAFDLGRKAIFHATVRDAASGGIVRVYSVKEDGWKIISEEDSKDLYYKYADEKMA
jgi:20S proteasome subunit beta 5